MADPNTTIPSTTQNGLTPEANETSLVFLVIACVCAGLWIIYLTFYHSRILGFILTKIINFKYMKDGQYFKIGSISVSFLSGKVMFRDVRYITRDLTFRLVDGFAIFKYWLPFKPVQSSRPYQVVPSDIVSVDQRLIVWLNGLEYHVYNRSGLYGRLEELFKRERYGDAASSTQNILDPEMKSDPEVQIESEDAQGGLPSWFMELIPSIKFDINTGKVAFGNKLLETTLCIQFESATGIYTTSQAESSLDEFMHLVKCQGKNVRMMLSPSPGYTGARDEPPRYMGEGFVVTQTSECKVTYYQDQPGFVPNIKPDGEAVLPDSDPHWGVDVQFYKGTTLCYGPWVDRQRVALQNFFYPLDYQNMMATKPSCPGQRRIHTGMDVKFEFDCNATMDVLFSKNRETKAVHLCVGAESYVRVYQPWIVNDYGYTTSVVAKLFQVEATTSLTYRPLVEADVLDLAFHTSFPRVWNETQHWATDVTACKVTWHFIFAHKWFFQEMIDDWTLNYSPDLLTFVPYEWAFNIVLKDFEMVWLTNQHNWIECTSTRQENAQVAFCGELFDLAFVLQYLRFVPEIEEIKFFLQADKLLVRMFLPEHNTLRRSILSVVRSGERRRGPGPRSRSSTVTANVEEGVESADENPRASGTDEDVSGGWRRHTDAGLGWVDVMSVPILGISLGYMYHPIVRNANNWVPRNKPLSCDPTEWEPDVITLELDAGPAALRLFGTLIKAVLAIKENYFGIDQEFKEYAAFASPRSPTKADMSSESGQAQEGGNEMIDLPSLRPFEANIFINLTDIKAELSKHCGSAEPTCPLLLMERLSFEMHKTYSETRLQLHLSPATILTTDSNERCYSSQHLSNGHVSLSGLQLRGHAMFSGEDRPPDVETLEYAWLVELQLGILSGKLTLPQLQSLGNWAETFVFHVADKENDLEAPTNYKQCIHGKMQNVCERRNLKRKAARNAADRAEPKIKIATSKDVESSGTLERKSGCSQLCYVEDDLKYRMTRFSLETIDLFVVESGCACNLQVSPIRLSTCDLHSSESGSGASLFIQTLKLRQFVLAPWSDDLQPLLEGAVHKRLPVHEDVLWLEAAAIHLGPVISDVSSATADPELYIDQKDFLEMHDTKFQRLWFLWDPDRRDLHRRHDCCGCVGGCNFFGRNTNGPKLFSAEKLDASDNDTGVGGFGSDGGLYEDGIMLGSDARPLMYSRDASLDAMGPSGMDRSPVGSVEAFTQRRYHVSASESSSPKLYRAGLYHKIEGDVDPRAEDESSRRHSYLSYGSSLNPVSTSSTVHQRMRYTRSTSMQGSGQSLNRTGRISSFSKSTGLRRVDSRFSRESEGSFYSCGSLLDENERPLRKATSVESFVSAVEDPGDLMQFDESAVLSRFVVSSPALVHKYSQHLTLLDCPNWSAPFVLPPEKRQFSVLHNLKERDSEDFLLPGVPLFTCRGEPKLRVPLLVKRYQGAKGPKRHWEDEEQGSSSSSEESVSLDATVRKSTPQGKRDQNEDSLEILEASEQGSSRKTQWNTVINTQDQASVSSMDVSPVNSLKKKPKRSINEGTVLLRVAGDVNILVTPLLVEALQRYLSSVARQENFLHPAAILDVVHDKCVDAAEALHHRRLSDIPADSRSPNPPSALQNEEPKEKQMVVMFSTSKINLCFLQAATLDLELQKKSRVEVEFLPESNAVPTVSLLAATVSGISAEFLSIRRKPTQVVGARDVEEDSQKSQSITEISKGLRSASLDDGLTLRKNRGHRNTMTTGDVKCNDIQFQLRRLCEVDDMMNSITTAIPEEVAQAKFQVNSDRYACFTDDFSTERLETNKIISLLMLECGLDNVVFRGGTERGSGKEIRAKLKVKNEAASRESARRGTPKVDPSPIPQGYSNPLFAKDTGSVEIKIDSPRPETQSETSSISSSCSSSLRISSDGNISDIESDSDLEATKPLLKSSRETESTAGVTISKIKEELPERDPEVARRTDGTVYFSNMWFNLASPSSVKTVPSNFHLYNSLVTTAVPVVTVWLLPIQELQTLLSSVRKARQRFVNSVIACLMAQALPEHGRIPKAHPVSGQVTDKARFLQEDHSSQLIYILRRQLLGSRLSKVRTSLFVKDNIPGDEHLVKGIFALARQWKCFLAGTEQGEIAFYGSNSIKRRVVGRGKLTDRDRAIIFGEEKFSRVEGQSTRLESIQENNPHPDSVVVEMKVLDAHAEVGTSQPHDAVPSLSETLPKDEPTRQLLPTPVHEETPQEETASESDVSAQRPWTAISQPVEFKKGHKKQLSLYSWLSNTPTTSPPSSRTKEPDDRDSSWRATERDRGWSLGPPDHSSALFGDMVSVPTSGMQIKDERETFKTFLQAINLMPRVAKKEDQASSFSLNTKLKCVHIHLVDCSFDNVGTKGKGKSVKNPRNVPDSKARIRKRLCKDTEPVFIAKEFDLKVNIDVTSSDVGPQRPLGTPALYSDGNSTKLTRVNFVVGCANITQRVNLSCVRLITQAIDMMHLLRDACSQKMDFDDVDGPRPSCSGAQTSEARHGASRKSTVGSEKCWQIMYQVLDLYSSLPREAKTKGFLKKSAMFRSLAAERSSPEKVKREIKIDIVDGGGERRPRSSEKKKSTISHTAVVFKDKEVHAQEVPTISVFGVVKLAKVRLLASVGELQLETEIKDLSVSASRREVKSKINKACTKSSVTGHLGKINVVLLEKIKRVTGIVVSCRLSRSHALCTCESRGGDNTKMVLVTLGVIDVDIPQHPVALHSMMTRSSRTISSHISEIQSQRSAIRSITSAELSSSRSSCQFSSTTATDAVHVMSSPSASKSFSAAVDTVDGKQHVGAKFAFDFVLKGFVLGASLLPSLRAEYRMGKITSSGKSGKNSSFKLSMPTHSLSFTSKIQSLEMGAPSSTVVDLPPVNMSGDYISQKPRLPRPEDIGPGMNGSQPRQSSVKGHLFVTAEVGAFEHMLTTDLLNHLVFVQKSFMKEVNDVVQRVSGESQPVPLWRNASTGELDFPRDKEKIPFLYFFKLNLKGIQVTATTPSATAVRLETDVVALEVSNAVPSSTFTGRLRRSSSYVKLFGKAQVDMNLSLGQFVKSRTIDNELDYQRLAFFKTTIGVQNSFQDGSPAAGTEGKETFLVTLTKPYVYVQRIAFDKAVLVYLNYKNAYDHWNEQRMSLNEGVHSATQAVLEKLPQRPPTTQLSGSLYLRLTIDQLGVCFPLYNTNQGLAQNYQPTFSDHEAGPALVLSVEEMLLTCCSSVSFVSRGKFKHFCLWLAEKFDTEADHWKPDWDVPPMNTCIVPDGTYELCTKTVRYPISPDMVQAGKWVMSVRWQMCGLQIDCDTGIGKRLSTLAQTLTSLVGEPDVANMDSVAEGQEKDTPQPGLGRKLGDTEEKRQQKGNSRNVEKEMWEQARKVNELRRRTDVENWLVEKEAKTLQKLENAVFNEFRKDVRKRLTHSRHGLSRGVYSRRSASDKRASGLTERKAHSEHVRGSRIRSRIKRRHHVDEYDNGNEMVEMGSPVLTEDDSFFLNATDIPLGTVPDEPCGLAGSKGSMSPSTFLPDALDLPTKLLNEGLLLHRSTPHRENEAIGPRVTFSCVDNDVQDQTVMPQRNVMQHNLDFALDVTVEIDSGKCVLHPASDGDKEDVVDVRSGMKRSLGPDFKKAKIFSPLYQPRKASVPGQWKPKVGVQDKGAQPEDTVLLFPAVNVRLHYFSNVDSEPVAIPCPPPTSPSDWDSVFAAPSTTATATANNLGSDTPRQIVAKKATKHAGLYVWVSLQSLPQEMVLKPRLLDFLEQALEPIVVPGEDRVDSMVGSVSDASSDVDVETGGSMVSSSMSEYSSFPVDVVVVLRVQPSDIRFSCLPVSRVECMLRLPALDVVFSSNSSPSKCNSPQPLGRDPVQVKVDLQDAGAPQYLTFDSGGINFTVCLSRFSFCIFHPYGKQHKGVGRTPSSDLEENVAEEGRARFQSIPTQPLSGKKDSLSLNVEFIKFNLSRRRVASAGTGSIGGSEDLASTSSSTVVKVSGVCDIGSAAFNYDMRRLNEILDFPKAWYKRGLGSRLFLGKEGTYATKTATDVTDTPPSSRGEESATRRSFPLGASSKSTGTRPPLTRSMSSDEKSPMCLDTPVKSAKKEKQGHKKAASGSGTLFSIFPSSPGLFRSMTASGLLGPSPGASLPPTPRRSTFSEVSRKHFDGQQPRNVGDASSSDTDTADSPRSQTSLSSHGSSKSKWETVIIVALNLSRLDMSTNMGSVMGQTVWRTSDLRAQSHLTLTNTGRRHVKATVVIRQAICESRSGIVGGHVEIHELHTKLKVNEERGCKPEHLVSLNLRYAEARVDYMGTCVLMGNMATFRTDLHDEWVLPEPNKSTGGSPVENGQDPVKAKIYMHGELAWTDFKVMISRSTTPDLVKMSAKIQEFFTQQHRNSMRALHTLRPHTPRTSGDMMRTGLSLRQTAETPLDNSLAGKDGLKYQHWGKVLNAVCGLKLSMLSFPLPDRGVLLGGTLSLQGKGVSLACFHGVNFRAQSWVLFTLERPFVQFASKVCSVEKSCQVRRARAVQELLIRLGHGVDENGVTGKLSPTSAHVAVVRKVSRGRRNPPSMGSTVQEWLGYVCATGEDEIIPPETFSSDRMRPDTNSLNRKNPRERKSSFTTSYRYEHDSEPIFGVPKLEVELKTEHDMPMTSVASAWSTKGRKWPTVERVAPPTPASPHVVECSLASYFDDSLCVTVDVALFMFLHDVVQTYIKENETSTSGSLQKGGTPASHARKDSRPDKDDKTHKVEGKRTRQFRSKAWKLEPRVRFLSWAGKNMDPVNIDWVLQKLGFMHARLTIPKWVQRGAMDPMDVVLSLLVDRLLAGMRDSAAYLGDQ